MGTTALPNPKLILSHIKNLSMWPVIMNVIFWGWNGLFALASAIVILPYILLPLLTMKLSRQAPIPWEIIIFSFLLIVEVAIAITIGVFANRNRFDFDTATKKDVPRFLFNFFYGVEAPLFMLTIYRLFFIREMTPAMTLVLGCVFIAIGLYTFHLFSPKTVTSKRGALAETIFSVIPALIALYMSFIILFFAIPAIYYFILGFFSFEWLSLFFHFSVFSVIISVVLLLLFGATTTLFGLLPVAVISIYLQASIQRIKESLKKITLVTVTLTAFIIIGTVTILWHYANIQPQIKTFALLDKFGTTQQGREQLLQNEPFIRKGLLNAYLAPYRYLSSTGSSNALTEMYAPILGNRDRSRIVQNIFNSIASPFLYTGSFLKSDVDKAEKAYEKFFDTPIQKKESGVINRAIRMTWDRGEIKAGLLNRENKKVLLKTQKMRFEQHGPIGKTTIYEKYLNNGSDQEEIFYTFSLPEQAAVTGLWLGETSDTLNRFSFTVSPRGAAQEVYNSQVVERRDPALIERVGPNQYRLRAFPVPPLDNKTMRDGELHLWLEISSLADSSGIFKLPRMIEKRNVYWDSRTKRSFPENISLKSDEWLPAFIKGSNNRIVPFTSKIDDSITIVYSPVKSDIGNEPLFTRNTAVIIDASRSMFSNINVINTAVKRLQHAARAQGVPITFFSACDTILTLVQPTGALSDQIFFFGQTTLTKICSLYSKHIDSTKYSSLIILSDDGGYEMTSDSEKIPSFSSPVFIVNISTSAASAYPDDLVEMVQKSGGAFAESTDELFARLRTVNYAALHPEFVTFAGDYVVNKTENVSLKDIPDAAQLSAKYYIGYYSRNAAMEQIFNLDYVHAIAKRYPVVTPYSSMIVLVDINQEKLLADAEKRDDRFDREIESGKEELSSPFDALKVNATPEPHEWMIIISIAVLALISIYIRNKKTVLQG